MPLDPDANRRPQLRLTDSDRVNAPTIPGYDPESELIGSAFAALGAWQSGGEDPYDQLGILNGPAVVEHGACISLRKSLLDSNCPARLESNSLPYPATPQLPAQMSSSAQIDLFRPSLLELEDRSTKGTVMGANLVDAAFGGGRTAVTAISPPSVLHHDLRVERPQAEDAGLGAQILSATSRLSRPLRALRELYPGMPLDSVSVPALIDLRKPEERKPERPDETQSEKLP